MKRIVNRIVRHPDLLIPLELTVEFAAFFVGYDLDDKVGWLPVESNVVRPTLLVFTHLLWLNTKAQQEVGYHNALVVRLGKKSDIR